MGLYSITTRAEGTVLTGFGSSSDIFNADHENHVEHTAAEFLNSWEATLLQMQATTSPVTGAGALVLPASLGDEIERIRFQIARIKQQMSGASGAPPFWYTAAADFSNGVQLAPTAARLEQTIAQSIPSGVFTRVTFQTTSYDTATLVSGSTFVAPVDGVYIVGGTLAFGDGVTQGPTGDFYLIIQCGGTPPGLIQTQNVAAGEVYSAVDQPKALNVEGVVRLTAGTVVRLMVFQNTGTPKQTLLDQDARPAMWMALVGRG